MFRYRLIRAAMQVVRLLIMTRIRVFGQENIPPRAPYIVVLNHTSVADTPILLLTFPLMPWRFFAVDKWRTHPIYGPVMKWLGAIYVKRDEVDRHQLREALAALANGKAFGLAPEGTRSFTGELKKAKDGAAYLASRAQATIVPVGIVGGDVLFHNAARLRPTQIEVHIGAPFRLPDLGRRVRSQDLPAYTHLIMAHIAAQLPEKYRGYYQDSAAVAALLAGKDPWPFCREERVA